MRFIYKPKHYKATCHEQTELLRNELSQNKSALFSRKLLGRQVPNFNRNINKRKPFYKPKSKISKNPLQIPNNSKDPLRYESKYANTSTKATNLHKTHMVKLLNPLDFQPNSNRKRKKLKIQNTDLIKDAIFTAEK